MIADVKERHEEDVQKYKQFCDYLEPSSLKDKLLGSIKKIERET